MNNLLKKGFERATRDADILELVEWGMGDYKRLVGRVTLA